MIIFLLNSGLLNEKKKAETVLVTIYKNKIKSMQNILC